MYVVDILGHDLLVASSFRAPLVYWGGNQVPSVEIKPSIARDIGEGWARHSDK